MPDKSIFLTGGTGFVGSAVLNELLSRGHRVRLLSRNRTLDREGVLTVKGGLFDAATLEEGVRGADAVIHLVGIIREEPSRGQTFERIHYDGAVNVIDAARHAGVSRFIHMSALGVREDSPSEYASTKARAEGYLRQSGLDYTILRPSIVLGEGGEFTNMMRDWASGKSMPYLFMPFFGRGLLGQSPAKLQPIRVEDVARAFVDCLDKPELIHKTIDLVGPDAFTWPQMYRLFAQHTLGKTKPSIGVPIWYARLLTKIAPASLLPFNRAQVEMAGEDSTSTVSTVQDHFGWQPEKMPWAK
jgi:NADH dehydrogenase